MFITNVLLSPLLYLKDTTNPFETVKEKKATNDHRDCGSKIRCPKCKGSPRKNDCWQCLCLHEWNTFDTGGVCPNCTMQWQETFCLACDQWSKHSDWYESSSPSSK